MHGKLTLQNLLSYPGSIFQKASVMIHCERNICEFLPPFSA